jgi:hypothetical protein
VRPGTLQSASEEVGQVGDVNRGPVLLPAAEHDQVAGVVPGRAEKYAGYSSATVAVRHAGDDHDAAHVFGGEHSAFDLFSPRHQRRRVERRVLGDEGIVPVDPGATGVQVGLAGSGERVDSGVDDGRVEVGAGRHSYLAVRDS